MKRKKVFFGWLEDQSYVRDYEIGEVMGRREDESLLCFKFGGACGRAADVLGLPLIFPKKKDWKGYGRPSLQIKLTMEFVKRGGKYVRRKKM